MAQRFDVTSINITDRQTFDGADPAILSGKMGLKAYEATQQPSGPAQPAPIIGGPGGLS